MFVIIIVSIRFIFILLIQSFCPLFIYFQFYIYELYQLIDQDHFRIRLI